MMRPRGSERPVRNDSPSQSHREWRPLASTEYTRKIKLCVSQLLGRGQSPDEERFLALGGCLADAESDSQFSKRAGRGMTRHATSRETAVTAQTGGIPADIKESHDLISNDAKLPG